MCVAATAKRRRRQLVLDKRYKKRDAGSSAKREAEYRDKQKAMQARTKKK